MQMYAIELGGSAYVKLSGRNVPSVCLSVRMGAGIILSNVSTS